MYNPNFYVNTLTDSKGSEHSINFSECLLPFCTHIINVLSDHLSHLIIHCFPRAFFEIHANHIRCFSDPDCKLWR